MYTIYRLEVDIVSGYVDYTEEQMEELVKDAINSIRASKLTVAEIECIDKD